MGKGAGKRWSSWSGLGVKREHFLKDHVILSCLFANGNDLVEAQIPMREGDR